MVVVTNKIGQTWSAVYHRTFFFAFLCFPFAPPPLWRFSLFCQSSSSSCNLTGVSVRISECLFLLPLPLSFLGPAFGCGRMSDGLNWPGIDWEVLGISGGGAELGGRWVSEIRIRIFYIYQKLTIQFDSSQSKIHLNTINGNIEDNTIHSSNWNIHSINPTCQWSA